MSRHHRRDVVGVMLERTLFVIAVLALGWYGIRLAESRLYQASQSRMLDEQLRDRMRGLDRTAEEELPREEEIPLGSVLGRLEIPRLSLSVVVREGDDPRTLGLAVGHLADTASPGRPGNAAIAGHRDTFFRKLRHIKRDDEILVTTSSGVHRYVVESTRVVSPDNISVLKSNTESVLTLITCYPFFFVGSAPERFIVRALLTEERDAQAASNLHH